ncbi:FecR family protein [Flavobacterium sp.]|uniref:FecR family protein n=1 Tax=Flavobacterium sp. TaxID=239 RepID=UPI0026376BFD|nr:FecR family protein [Flavobacterium sp.]
MKNSVNKDTYLADWISGELTDDKLKGLISKDEFDSYILVRDSISGMRSFSPDIELAYAQLKDVKRLNLPNKFQAGKSLRLYYTSAAAIILLFVTLASYHYGIFGTKNFSTSSASRELAIGKNISMFIYQNTSISQNAPLYNEKEITLDYGKVYFEVRKGQMFKINTDKGYVMVLGTKFIVESMGDILNVKCYEGRVKVSHNALEYIVDSGQEFNSQYKNVKALKEPSHPDNIESGLYYKFRGSYIIDVELFLEKNYQVEITFPKEMQYQKFTATLPKNDLERCLRLIASSFHLKYVIKDDQVIFKE